MGEAGNYAKKVGAFLVGGPIGLAKVSEEDPPPGARQVTKQQYDAAIADWTKTHSYGGGDTFPGNRPDNQFDSLNDYNAGLQKFKDTMSVLPPPAPDLADADVQRARQAARRKLLMGGLTGPLDLSGAATGKSLPGLTGT